MSTHTNHNESPRLTRNNYRGEHVWMTYSMIQIDARSGLLRLICLLTPFMLPTLKCNAVIRCNSFFLLQVSSLSLQKKELNLDWLFLWQRLYTLHFPNNSVFSIVFKRIVRIEQISSSRNCKDLEGYSDHFYMYRKEEPQITHGKIWITKHCFESIIHNSLYFFCWKKNSFSLLLMRKKWKPRP